MSYYIPRNDELYHYGILGMKWGVRRYENPDGSLTAAGKQRYSKGKRKLTDKQKKIIRNVAIGAGATAAIAGLGYLGYRKLQPTYLKEAIGSAQDYGKKVAPDMKKYYNNEILRISKNTNVVNPYKKSGMPFKTTKGSIAKPLALPSKSSYVKPRLKTKDIAGKSIRVRKGGTHDVSYSQHQLLNMKTNRSQKYRDYTRGVMNNEVSFHKRIMKDYNKSKSDWNKFSKADKQWTNAIREGIINSSPANDLDIYKVQKLGEKASSIGKNRLKLARKGFRHSDLYSDELYHHGVLGMKWGVRKERLSEIDKERRATRRKKVLKDIGKRAVPLIPGVALLGAGLVTKGLSKKALKTYGKAHSSSMEATVNGINNAFRGNVGETKAFTRAASQNMKTANRSARAALALDRAGNGLYLGSIGASIAGGIYSNRKYGPAYPNNKRKRRK